MTPMDSVGSLGPPLHCPFLFKIEATMDREVVGRAGARAALCLLPSLGRLARATGSGRVPRVQVLPDGPSGSLTTCCLQPSQAQAEKNQRGAQAQLRGPPADGCVCNPSTLFLELGFSNMGL